MNKTKLKEKQRKLPGVNHAEIEAQIKKDERSHENEPLQIGKLRK
jgi:hypothetical protein